MEKHFINELKPLDGVKGNLRKHFHDDYSITIIKDGSCRTRIEGDIHELRAGDVMLVAPRSGSFMHSGTGKVC